jgi:hypothetical protein
LREQKRRARMSQVMEPNLRNAGCYDQLVELRHEAVDVERAANRVGKDESMIRPGRTKREPMLQLTLLDAASSSPPRTVVPRT